MRQTITAILLASVSIGFLASHASAEPKELSTLKGHSNKQLGEYGVRTVAFSSDSKLLASGGADAVVGVWNVQTGEAVFALKGHTQPITSVVFSTDGKLLGSASADGTIRLWDVKAGKELFNLKGHTHQVKAIAFSRDGSTLVSASLDKSAALWDTTTGKAQAVFRDKVSVSATAVALSPDGKLVAVGQAAAVELWDVATGKSQRIIENAAVSKVSFCCFSEDGKTLYVSAGNRSGGSGRGSIKLFDTGTWKERAEYAHKQEDVLSFSISVDGKLGASACHDRKTGVGTARVWDTQSGKELAEIKAAHKRGGSSDVFGVALSHDGKLLATAGVDATIKLWELNPAK